MNLCYSIFWATLALFVFRRSKPPLTCLDLIDIFCFFNFLF